MTEIPDWIGDYLNVRQRQRIAEVNEVLASLTEKERALVREAAVMGYVLGSRAPQIASVPPDSKVVHDVVASCLDYSDLYPLLGAAKGGPDD